MSRNGAGAYSLYTPGNPVVTGTTISSAAFNNTMNDIATALTTSLAYDGQTVPIANIPMGGFKITNLGPGIATGQAMRFDETATQIGIQTQLYTYYVTAGTNTAYTLTPSPALTALAAGNRFSVQFNNTSGTTPTLTVSGLAPKYLKYYDATGTKQSVTSANLIANIITDVLYDGTDWVVLDPISSASSGVAFPPSVQYNLRGL